jgi:hypothetical protein
MHKTISLCLIALSLSGCGTSWHAKSDPVEEARTQISKGNFELMGLADFSKEDFWIPGVAGHKKDHKRTDVTWHGVSGQNDPYIQSAEPYMKQFNRIILESRNGQKIDFYGHSPKNKDYISPEKLHAGYR